ncbi:MAG: ABC transporter permease [Bradymonadia bacterium]
MRAIIHVLQVELVRFFADPKGAVLTVLMPLTLGALLGMLFSPDALSGQVQLLVADEDGGPRVQALIQALDDDDGIRVERVSVADGEAAVTAGRVPALLVIPQGTDAALSPRQLLEQPRPVLPLRFDPARAAERARLEGSLRRTVARHIVSTVLAPKPLAELLEGLKGKLAMLPAVLAERIRAVVTEIQRVLRDLPDISLGPEGIGGALPPPVNIVAEQVSEGQGTEYHPYAHTFAGMLCQFLMFMAASMARGLIADGQRGALSRLRAAPVEGWQILVGAGCGASVVALLGSLLVYGVAIPVFGVTVEGSWLGLGAVLVGQAIFIGGFMLLLAGLGRTERQVETVGTFVILTMSFLGGAWIPAFLMPEWVQGLGHAVPTWWATEGLAAMTWRGLPLSAALASAGALTGFGLFCAAVGLKRFRWG